MSVKISFGYPRVTRAYVLPNQQEASNFAMFWNVKEKFVGCTVLHKYTGTLAICNEELLEDSLWEFFDARQVKY